MEVEIYQSEAELLGFFVSNLETQDSPWGELKVSREFYYKSGRADVVAVNQEGLILAFEGKLTKWRHALHQAYRNLCFAHLSYVVLPKNVAFRACRFETEFRKRSVGLCYMEGCEPVVLVEAESVAPLQPWLSGIVASIFLEEHSDHNEPK